MAARWPGALRIGTIFIALMGFTPSVRLDGAGSSASPLKAQVRTCRESGRLIQYFFTLLSRELEGGGSGLNMSTMAKKFSTKPSRAAKSGGVSSSKVAGKTSDGVVVLRAKAKPTHFTAKQIRETIQRTGLALGDRSTAKR